MLQECKISVPKELIAKRTTDIVLKKIFFLKSTKIDLRTHFNIYLVCSKNTGERYLTNVGIIVGVFSP